MCRNNNNNSNLQFQLGKKEIEVVDPKLLAGSQWQWIHRTPGFIDIAECQFKLVLNVPEFEKIAILLLHFLFILQFFWFQEKHLL